MALTNTDYSLFLPPKTLQSEEGNTNMKQQSLGGRTEAADDDEGEGMERKRRDLS